jgi:hypothetical protein
MPAFPFFPVDVEAVVFYMIHIDLVEGKSVFSVTRYTCQNSPQNGLTCPISYASVTK